MRKEKKGVHKESVYETSPGLRGFRAPSQYSKGGETRGKERGSPECSVPSLSRSKGGQKQRRNRGGLKVKGAPIGEPSEKEKKKSRKVDEKRRQRLEERRGFEVCSLGNMAKSGREIQLNKKKEVDSAGVQQFFEGGRVEGRLKKKKKRTTKRPMP